MTEPIWAQPTKALATCDECGQDICKGDEAYKVPGIFPRWFCTECIRHIDGVQEDDT